MSASVSRRYGGVGLPNTALSTAGIVTVYAPRLTCECQKARREWTSYGRYAQEEKGTSKQSPTKAHCRTLFRGKFQAVRTTQFRPPLNPVPAYCGQVTVKKNI